MKVIVLLALVAVAVARPDGEFYDSKYDNFNVDELIGNDRLLKAYTLCMLRKGNCTPEGADFRKWTPEAVQSSCGKCTEKQKALVAKAMSAMKNKLPTEYAELIKMHDPENKHEADIQTFLDKYSS